MSVACFCTVLGACFYTGHFVMAPLNMTYLRCLQNSCFEQYFNLYNLNDIIDVYVMSKFSRALVVTCGRHTSTSAHVFSAITERLRQTAGNEARWSRSPSLHRPYLPLSLTLLPAFIVCIPGVDCLIIS